MQTADNNKFIDQNKPAYIWFAIVIAIEILFAYLGINAFHSFNEPWAIIDGILFCIVPLPAVLLIVLMKQETILSNEGIYYRLYPMPRKYIKVSWQDVSEIYIRQISPITEFGGWGLRYSRDTTAINIAGNKGMQVVLKNGKQLFIGTKNTEQIRQYLMNLSDKGIINYVQQ